MTESTIQEANRGANDPGAVVDRYDDYRIRNNNVERIPPRDRGFIGPSHHPGIFYGPDPHYFGYRIEYLPSRYRRMSYFGIDYFVYDDIYYRSYGGHYVICRPPVGILLGRRVRPAYFSPVRFAFYTNIYRTYSYWDPYYRYIDEQNRIIAQNNATIARQSAQIAMNLNMAENSYQLANQLGLAQSYAYANQEYYYDDGVFYIINRDGRYEVIVPPAGALVEELPDDYDTIVLGGVQYYRVDDTVYRVVMQGGHPYLEVLGQMYGDMARRYSQW